MAIGVDGFCEWWFDFWSHCDWFSTFSCTNVVPSENLKNYVNNHTLYRFRGALSLIGVMRVSIITQPFLIKGVKRHTHWGVPTYIR